MPHRKKLVASIRSTETIFDDLQNLENFVAVRGGAVNKRTAEQREDRCLRCYLFALNEVKRLSLPIEAWRPNANSGFPDFVLDCTASSLLGLEVTEAGSEGWQQELTRSSRPELDENSGFVQFLSDDGYVGKEPERMAVEDVKNAVENKLKKLNIGSYSALDRCDLLIYLNSKGHLLADHAEFIRMLRVVLIGWQDLKKPFFRSIHTLSDRFADLDLTLRTYRRVDIRKYLPPSAVAAE